MHPLEGTVISNAISLDNSKKSEHRFIKSELVVASSFQEPNFAMHVVRAGRATCGQVLNTVGFLGIADEVRTRNDHGRWGD